jgi:hypothetical protein
MIEKLLSPEVQKFIKDHQGDDPFLLSLNAKEPDDFPVREAIEQIQSLQKAKAKSFRRGQRQKASSGLLQFPSSSLPRKPPQNLNRHLSRENLWLI